MHWPVPRLGRDLALHYDRDRISTLTESRPPVWERGQRADFHTLNERRPELGLAPVGSRDGAGAGVTPAAPARMIVLRPRPSPRESTIRPRAGWGGIAEIWALSFRPPKELRA